MEAILLSRLQFAFTIAFHIIFPSFTIGLAAWLTLLETLHVITNRHVYRRLFDFWLKIFGIAFGLGVVSGIVMAFEFGTNWSRLSEVSGPIQGPLLSYESFTAFALEAAFFGVLMFGRARVKPLSYLASVFMVALGTTLSSFWIMVNNSWMQAPVGFDIKNGQFVPTSWMQIIFNPVVWVRFPHTVLAAYLTGAFCVAATGAWYRLQTRYGAESRVMLRMGLFLAAVLVPLQILFGHLNGDYVHQLQPAKFAAIEARWHDEQPAAEVLFAWPDDLRETNHAEFKIPYLGSLVATTRLNSREVGLTDFSRADRPPVAIPFFSFRVMVACGLAMLALAWLGSWRALRESLDGSRRLLQAIFFSFPLPFIATLAGWFTAEVGRQPWTVYGVLRTADSVSPNLTVSATLTTLIVYGVTYMGIFSFGTLCIYRVLRHGPGAIPPSAVETPLRPMTLGNRDLDGSGEGARP